ncbi:MAG: hypothetical protein IJ574_04035 [Bacilli bacterium]|nr:hypothetical protein [Bacilli bacterium]
MNKLSIETTKLLDKLYNLRGDDSEILVEMDNAKQAAINTKERTTEEKNILQDKIKTLQNDEEVLSNEGEKLKDILKNIDVSNYSNVLDRLHIEFNPQALYNALCDKLPQEIDTVKKEHEDAVSELELVEEEMNKAITEIDELGLRREEAIADQNKLNEYFELSLSGNNGLTRDIITSLLSKFGFNEEDQREAAKLLMFPEDALYAYDEKVSGVKREEIKSPDEEIKVEDKEEKIEVEEIKEKSENNEETHHFSSTDYDDMVRSINSLVSKNDDIKMCLEHIGLDPELYTDEELNTLSKNIDDILFEKNVTIAKDNNIDLDIFVDNINLLMDKEFGQKIDKLINVGKAPLDIYLNPDILTKYDLNGLNNAITVLQNNGLDPRKVPLIAY